MAFFKFRKGGDEHATAAPTPAPESVEAMRTRARHRLIGASVLVLVGVIGFPLLFDSQPRPVSVDIPIEIPDKNTVKPLGSGTAPAATATTAAANNKPGSDIIVESDAGKETAAKPTTAPATPTAPATTTPAAVASRTSAGTVSATPAPVATPAKPVAKPETKPEAKPVEKPADKPAAKPAEKPADKPAPARSDDGAKAQALLEGKDAPAATSASATASSRFVVQIGAFSDGVKAHEARVKLEKAGMKTYTQVVNPAEGKRIRVRVGPFGSKGEADKVADKIRKLDLPASVLEL